MLPPPPVEAGIATFPNRIAITGEHVGMDVVAALWGGCVGPGAQPGNHIEHGILRARRQIIESIETPPFAVTCDFLAPPIDQFIAGRALSTFTKSVGSDAPLG